MNVYVVNAVAGSILQWERQVSRTLWSGEMQKKGWGPVKRSRAKSHRSHRVCPHLSYSEDSPGTGRSSIELGSWHYHWAWRSRRSRRQPGQTLGPRWRSLCCHPCLWWMGPRKWGKQEIYQIINMLTRHRRKSIEVHTRVAEVVTAATYCCQYTVQAHFIMCCAQLQHCHQYRKAKIQSSDSSYLDISGIAEKRHNSLMMFPCPCRTRSSHHRAGQFVPVETHTYRQNA